MFMDFKTGCDAGLFSLTFASWLAKRKSFCGLTPPHCLYNGRWIDIDTLSLKMTDLKLEWNENNRVHRVQKGSWILKPGAMLDFVHKLFFYGLWNGKFNVGSSVTILKYRHRLHLFTGNLGGSARVSDKVHSISAVRHSAAIYWKGAPISLQIAYYPS